MDLIIGNPIGFIAAAIGIPAVLLIHFLQRKSRTVTINTLFLIENKNRESRAGRRLQFWRNSPSFWLQIIAVLLLTWLLAQPRWIRSESHQHIAFVLDSSLSMAAFEQPLKDAITAQASKLERTAAQTTWHLIPSDPNAPSLYRGTKKKELLAALEQWHPTLGEHDISPALRSAQLVTRSSGLIVYVTDHTTTPLPSGIHRLAIGDTLDNLGFTGVQIEYREGQTLWRTLVKNYSAQPQTAKWWLELKGQRSEARAISIPANQSYALQGAFPEGQDKVELVLADDAFGTDNRLPIIRPLPKTLTVNTTGSDSFQKWIQPIKQSLPQTIPAVDATQSDLLFCTYLGIENQQSTLSRIIFLNTESETSDLVQPNYTHESHPLIEGLNWNGLLYKKPTTEIPLQSNDQVLLWGNQTPLIFLREMSPRKYELYFNLVPDESNLERLPSFILLTHRFVELVRRAKPSFHRTNIDSHQKITLRSSGPLTLRQTHAEQIKEINLTTAQANALRAPATPSFITLAEGENTLLEAAVQFADTREADFSAAGSSNDLTAVDLELATLNSEPDRLLPLWLLLLAATLLANWHYTGRQR